MFYPIITTLDAGGGGRAGISKNVAYAGSQLTWEILKVTELVESAKSHP